jgi:hypothetical protein
MKKFVSIALALASVAFTLFSLSLLFYDKQIFLYANVAGYAYLRWLLVKEETLYVKNKVIMYALRAYLVLIGLFVFSGSGVWQSKSSLITSLASLISLIFAYDIWRHFKKVKVAEVIFQEESINDEKIT